MVSLGVDDGEVYLGLGGCAVASRRVVQEQVKGSREMRRERARCALIFSQPFPGWAKFVARLRRWGFAG
jgi:hypothetical protein